MFEKGKYFPFILLSAENKNVKLRNRKFLFLTFEVFSSVPFQGESREERSRSVEERTRVGRGRGGVCLRRNRERQMRMSLKSEAHQR